MATDTDTQTDTDVTIVHARPVHMSTSPRILDRVSTYVVTYNALHASAIPVSWPRSTRYVCMYGLGLGCSVT